MKIIGIGGMVRSGKDTLADLLIENGYFGFSFGDYVRKRSFERHKDKTDPISVENMTDTSNWLREEYGADVVLVDALKEFEKENKTGKYKGVVLYSVRVPVEVDFILEHGGDLVWVEASAETRHQRGLNALRDGEAAQSLEEFIRQESLQWEPQPGIPVEAQMSLSYVKKHATIEIENNQNSLEKFQATVHDKLKEYLDGQIS